MRGIRNNNPLNIRHSADQWQGARAEQTDKVFVQFTSMAYGYRAAWKVLDTYCLTFKRERKAYNVRNIIDRWAPPTENDTQAYIRTVLKLSGLGGNENLPQPSRGVDTDRLERLVAAMTTMECGIPYREVDVQAIWDGYELAFPGKLCKDPPVRPSEGSPIVETPFHIDLPADVEACRHWDEYWDWSPRRHME